MEGSHEMWNCYAFYILVSFSQNGHFWGCKILSRKYPINLISSVVAFCKSTSHIPANNPHPQHPTSRTSHIPNNPHLHNPTSPTSHISINPHPQHPTSPTSHIPNIPHPEHHTSPTYNIPNIPHMGNNRSQMHILLLYGLLISLGKVFGNKQ